MRFPMACCISATIFLSGCFSDMDVPVDGSSRFSIDAYKEATTLATDLTGIWMVVHNGQLNETIDDVDYVVTGNIREIVEITKTGGVFYLRTCLQPEYRRVISVSGNAVSMTMNIKGGAFDDVADLVKTSNTRMSGTAAHSAAGSQYSGTLQMKKVAPLNDNFGLFTHFTAAKAKDVATASCFQEGALHIVGKVSIFSQWSDVEIFNVSDWTSSTTFQQTGYLMSRAGTADPARQMRFREGTVGMDATEQDYPASNETITVITSSATVNSYRSTFSVGSVVSGSIDLNFDIDDPLSVGTGDTGTTPGGSTGGTPGTGGIGDGSFWDLMGGWPWKWFKLPWW